MGRVTVTFAALCFFMAIHGSTAILRDYYGLYYEEPLTEVSCANCTIDWDTMNHEYLACDGMDDGCPEGFGKKIVDTHDDTARFYNHTWLSVRKVVQGGSYFIIIPETDLEKDYEVGDGTGAEEIEGCFLCMAVYVEYKDERSTYNYCVDDDCSKYPKYTARFSWDPVRDIVASQKQICTDYTIPTPVGSKKTTHGHCYLDWKLAPLDITLPPRPEPRCNEVDAGTQIAPAYTLTLALAGLILLVF